MIPHGPAPVQPILLVAGVPGSVLEVEMLRRTAVFVAVYAVSIALGRATAQPETGLALIWPAAGIGVLWVLRTRSPRELQVALTVIGALAAVGNALTGFSVESAVILGASNVLTCLLTRRFLLGRIGDTGGRTVHRLSHFYALLVAGGLATALGAAVGMLGIAVDDVAVTGGTALGWWLRNTAAIIVIAAPALTLTGRSFRPTRAAATEAALIYLLTLGLVAAVFAPGQTLPLAFVPLALVVWAALRLPLCLAAAEGGLIAVGSLVMLRATGGGPFGAIDDPHARGLVLQGYMMLVVILALVLATVHDELDDVVAGLAAARRRAERTAEDLNALIADAPYGVVLVSTSGRILRANRAMAAMFDCSVDDITGSEATAFSTRPAAEVRAYLADTAEARGELVETDWATHSRTGRPLHLALSSRLLTSRSGEGEILVNVVDVSERRRSEEHLTHLAAHDVLTGLPNRRRFEEVLARHTERCALFGQQGALLLVDLDRFKQVNDSDGHAVGDDLLRGVAAVLRDALRGTDTVARLGGDEFAVLLPEGDAAAAETVAAGLVQRVREHCASLEGASRSVTASVGVVSCAAAAERGEDALALADHLMYGAKRAGRDGYAVAGATVTAAAAVPA